VTVADRRGREATYAARLQEKLAATEPPRHRSTEMVVDVIEALVTGDPIDLPLNIPNAGQCPDLPPDVVVESMCTVGASGICGRDRAVAPPALAALFTDPLAGSLDHARLLELASAIVDATAAWLPQFAATAG
jgi:Family 4 glycosyl hydrolase C-terminal domain